MDLVNFVLGKELYGGKCLSYLEQDIYRLVEEENIYEFGKLAQHLKFPKF